MQEGADEEPREAVGALEGTFSRLPSLRVVLSMILMATSTPVSLWRASFTLAKLPLPMVCTGVAWGQIGRVVR